MNQSATHTTRQIVTTRARWFGLVVAGLLLTLLLAACGGSGQQPTSTPIPAEPPTNTPVPNLATPVPSTKPELGVLWEQIVERGSIRVGTSADYPPFEFYTENFQLDGFDIALMRAIGEELDLEVEFTDMAFDGLGDAANLGQIDVAIAAISVTPQREEYFDFSHIYFVSEDAYLAADASTSPINSIEDLAAYRVGVQSGSIFHDVLEDALVSTGLMSETDLFVYQLIDQSFIDLREGRVDVIVMDKEPALLTAQTEGFEVIGQGLRRELYAIGMPEGQNTLRTRINQALLTLIDQGFLAKLAKQYMDLEVHELPVLPTPTPEPVNPTVTPAPPPTACQNGMAWVADLSYDDNNMKNPPVLQPGEPFQKGWRVRNTGTCTWDSSYSLNYVRGNQNGAQMNGQPAAVQGTVAPGATYDIYVDLVAPLRPGTYQGFWQMRSGQGAFFGQTVYVGIRVPASATPTPVATQTPSADIKFWADSTNLNQGQCTNLHWDVQNVKEVYLYEDGQNWQNQGVAGKGDRQVCPPQTTNYNLRVVKSDNSVETRRLTIQVQGGNAPVISHYTVDPPAIQLGQCVNISWDVTGNVSTVKLTRDGASLWNGAPFRGSYSDCPPQAGSVGYGLEATGSGGTNRTTKHITVSTTAPTMTPSPGPVIYNFSVTPTEIQANDCVGIAWSTGGSTSKVTLKRNGQTVQDNAGLNGQEQDCLGAPGTYNYQLVASDNKGQTETQDVNVQVVQAQPPTATPAPQPTDTPAPQPTATPAPQPPTIIFFAITSDGTNQVSQINAGECVILTWRFEGQDLAYSQITRNGEQIVSDPQMEGGQNDCPPVGRMNYQLKVDSEFGGSATREAVLEVIDPAAQG